MIRLFWQGLFPPDVDALAKRKVERSQMYERCQAIEEKLRRAELTLLDEQALIDSRTQ